MERQAKKWLTYLFGVVLLSLALQSGAGFSTVTAVTATTKALPNCLKWQLRGFCYWLTCSWTRGCYITKTLKVSHYIPDALVSVFSQPGKNPWKEANILYDRYALQVARQQAKARGFSLGQGEQGSSGEEDDSVKLYEVNVIGHPVLPLFGKGVLHKPTVKPWQPYFQSLIDLIPWREKLESFDIRGFLPGGQYDVGNYPYYTWGTVFPRHGFVEQPNRTKAASVIALRAADIVARRTGLHVARPLGTRCGKKCEAVAFKVNTDSTRWQMLYPTQESHCEVLGQKEVKSEGDRYAWVLWRKYQGCIDGSGSFLWSIDF